MLLKPSTATSLVDLQAEFNMLALAEPNKVELNKKAATAIQIDLDWDFDKYMWVQL